MPRRTTGLRRLQEALRTLEQRGVETRKRARLPWSRREAARVANRTYDAGGLDARRIGEWLGKPGRAPRDPDQVWALVQVWAAWAEEGPGRQQRRYWNQLVEDAQPLLRSVDGADDSSTSGESSDTENPEAERNVTSASGRVSRQRRYWTTPLEADHMFFWGRQFRGVIRSEIVGNYFTGRNQVLRELVDWLNQSVPLDGAGAGGARIVTGGPGSGKSAVLARLVFLADAQGRLLAEHNGWLDDVPPETVPQPGAVDVAIRATAMSLEQIILTVAAAAEIDLPSGLVIDEIDSGSSTMTIRRGKVIEAAEALVKLLVDQQHSLANGAYARTPGADAGAPFRRFTLVIDALDEAVDPEAISTHLLRPLAGSQCTRAGIRLLVASRPDLLVGLNDQMTVLDLDHEYAEPDDLINYSLRCLVLHDEPEAWSPYRDQLDAAARVATAVAKHAYPSFLIAQLTSRTLAEQETTVEPDTGSGQFRFPNSVDDAMDRYLSGLPESGRQVRELLAPLAWVRSAAGLPVGELWVRLADALADRKDHYSVNDLRSLVTSQTAAYLVEDANPQSGHSHARDEPVGAPPRTYRLFHAALAQSLRARSYCDDKEVQRRLTQAMIASVALHGDGLSRDWMNAPTYVRTYLAVHAADADLLDELLTDPGYLLAADFRTLRSVLPPAENDQSITHIYTCAAEHFGFLIGDLKQRAVRLAHSAQEHGAHDLANRVEHVIRAENPRSLALRWAKQPRTLRKRREFYPETNDVCFAELNGRPVLVTGGFDGAIRVWKPDSGALLHALAVDGAHYGDWGCGVNHVAAWNSGTTLMVTFACEISQESMTVQTWDISAGSCVGTFQVPRRQVCSFAVTDLGGRLVVVTGDDITRSPCLRVRDLTTGRLINKISTARSRSVRDLCVTTLAHRPVAVCLGDDSGVQAWDLETLDQVRELTTQGTAVERIAVGEFDGSVVVACAQRDGIVRVHDLANQTQLSVFDSLHGDWLRALTIGRLDGENVIFSSGVRHSHDGPLALISEVRVWRQDGVLLDTIEVKYAANALAYAGPYIAVGHERGVLVAEFGG